MSKGVLSVPTGFTHTRYGKPTYYKRSELREPTRVRTGLVSEVKNGKEILKGKTINLYQCLFMLEKVRLWVER